MHVYTRDSGMAQNDGCYETGQYHVYVYTRDSGMAQNDGCYETGQYHVYVYTRDSGTAQTMGAMKRVSITCMFTLGTVARPKRWVL